MAARTGFSAPASVSDATLLNASMSSGPMVAPIAPAKRAKVEPGAPAVAAPTHGSVEAHNARAPRRAASGVESVVSSTERRRRIEIMMLEQQVLEGQQKVLVGQLAVAKAVQEDSRSGSQVGSVGRRIVDVLSGSDDDLSVHL